MTKRKSADTESLLFFYEQAMCMHNIKEGTRCAHADVIEAIKSANYVNEDTILRTLRRYRKRPDKSRS